MLKEREKHSTVSFLSYNRLRAHDLLRTKNYHARERSKNLSDFMLKNGGKIMMLEDILVEPVLSEKATLLREEGSMFSKYILRQISMKLKMRCKNFSM